MVGKGSCQLVGRLHSSRRGGGWREGLSSWGTDAYALLVESGTTEATVGWPKPTRQEQSAQRPRTHLRNRPMTAVKVCTLPGRDLSPIPLWQGPPPGMRRGPRGDNPADARYEKRSGRSVMCCSGIRKRTASHAARLALAVLVIGCRTTDDGIPNSNLGPAAETACRLDAEAFCLKRANCWPLGTRTSGSSATGDRWRAVWRLASASA